MVGEDLSKYAPTPVLIGLDENSNIIRVRALSWGYKEGDTIVLDLDKFKEYFKKYVPIYAPLRIYDDERDVIVNEYVDCHKFYLYQNYDFIEVGGDYVVVKRGSDGVLFKLIGYGFKALLEVLAEEGECDLCTLLNLFIIRLIRDRALSPEDLALLEKDFDSNFDKIYVKYVKSVIHPLGMLANEAGIIIIKKIS